MSRPLWRSLLFIPADRNDLIKKAPQYHPDGVIIDLEDGVAAENKNHALENLSEKISFLHRSDISVLLRADPCLDKKSLNENINQLAAIMLPKIESAADIMDFSKKIEQPKADFIAMIENPRALENAHDIASLPCVIGLALGSEDFCLALNVPPSPPALDLPCKLIALAAAAYDKAGFGLPISVGEFGNLEAYRSAAGQAQAIGLCGALCVHPAQVKIVNDVFRPSQADIALAQKIIIAWEKREKNIAVIAVAGRMVDAPVAACARRMLEKI